jgi:hypothetical protein
MYVTGSVTASRAARAGSRTCMRSARAVKDGRPAASRTTISPSSNVSGGMTRVEISGYATVTVAPDRAYSRGGPPSKTESTRTPSHLNS